jgi:hypothetical protein
MSPDTRAAGPTHAGRAIPAGVPSAPDASAAEAAAAPSDEVVSDGEAIALDARVDASLPLALLVSSMSSSSKMSSCVEPFTAVAVVTPPSVLSSAASPPRTGVWEEGPLRSLRSAAISPALSLAMTAVYRIYR